MRAVHALFRLFLLTAMVGLTACGPMIVNPPSASQSAPLETPVAAAIPLNTGDVVKLTVFGEDALTGQYTVDPRGSITVPMIGEVPAAGLSKTDLQTAVANKLVAGQFVKQPLVTVDVITMRPFYILGEVKNPGAFPWTPSMDVFKAVATAGGYTPRAAENKVLIDRGEGAKRQHLNATEKTPVLPGDSITVRERIF